MKIKGLEVKNGYEKTGLKPVYGKMYRKNDDCACALGVLYIAKYGVDKIDDLGNAQIWEWAEQTYGVHFVYGFWNGFDGYVGFEPESPESQEGYENGCYIRKFIGYIPEHLKNANN